MSTSAAHLSSAPAAVRACPLCGGFDRKAVARLDEWDLVQCTTCKMIFLDGELPYETQASDHDWLDEYNKERARRKKRHPLLMSLSRAAAPLRPATNNRLLAHTLHYCKSGKLVDFGCGDGTFLSLAAKHFEVTGIELSPRFAELARLALAGTPGKILEGPLTEVAERELPAGAFDVVTQFGYIEHEWRPLDALRATHHVLRPGGVLVIKTPNYASWNRRIMGRDWCGYHTPAHCNYFTPRTLAKILRAANFEPLPRPLADRFPTSDSLWLAARKPA